MLIKSFPLERSLWWSWILRATVFASPYCSRNCNEGGKIWVAVMWVGVLLLRTGTAARHILKLSPCTNDISLRLFYCNQLKNTLMSQHWLIHRKNVAAKLNMCICFGRNPPHLHFIGNDFLTQTGQDMTRFGMLFCKWLLLYQVPSGPLKTQRGDLCVPCGAPCSVQVLHGEHLIQPADTPLRWTPLSFCICKQAWGFKRWSPKLSSSHCVAE